MKKKVLLIAFVLLVLTAVVVGSSVQRGANIALQRGSLEEFQALALSQEILYRETADKNYFGDTDKGIFYLWGLDENDPLRQMFGNVRVLEEGLHSVEVLYVTQPTQALRDELQQEPEFQYVEVALAKCDFSHSELSAADEKMTQWLKTAPKSVSNSVQLVLVMPDQNRVAVYVKNWSGSDHNAMTRAMGVDCPKFFVVESDLIEDTEQIISVPDSDWGKEPYSLEGEYKEYVDIVMTMGSSASSHYTIEELRYLYKMIYSEDDWRMKTLNSMVSSILSSTVNKKGFFICSRQEFDYPYRTTPGNEPEYIEYYPEWSLQQEYLFRAVMSNRFPGQIGVICYNYDWYLAPA